ncbi:MAG: hypothetical protein HY520_00165 [Candidatus Aenigmarchaeota archaeon]|nr:hypothetical protein [Candidatus Aenigmarchaeota archaeon]
MTSSTPDTTPTPDTTLLQKLRELNTRQVELTLRDGRTVAGTLVFHGSPLFGKVIDERRELTVPFSPGEVADVKPLPDGSAQDLRPGFTLLEVIMILLLIMLAAGIARILTVATAERPREVALQAQESLAQEVTTYVWTPAQSSFDPVVVEGADSGPGGSSLLLPAPGKSSLSLSFPVRMAVPVTAVLEIVHGMAAGEASGLRAGSCVRIQINGWNLVEALWPASASGSLSRFQVSKHLVPGQNTIRLSPQDGDAPYLVERICVRIAVTAAALGQQGNATFPPEQPTVMRSFFERGMPSGELEVSTDYVFRDHEYGGRYALFAKNRSALTATGHVADPPAAAALVLYHLSSLLAGEPLGGRSPVSVEVNGVLVAKGMDPGCHGPAEDRMDISAFVCPGANTIRIALEDAPSQYSLLGLAMELGPASR